MVSQRFFICLALTWRICCVSSISPCDLRKAFLKSRSQENINSMLAVNRPILEEIIPTTVNVAVIINDIRILNGKTMDIEIDLLMSQSWYDHRLAPDIHTRTKAVTGGIWNPKITFVVGSTCSMFGEDSTQYWRGTANGSVFYSERYSIKPRCTLNLKRYPFDVQICSVIIGSYRFTADEVVLNWIREPVEIRTASDFSEFRLGDPRTYISSDFRGVGNFSTLVLDIPLKRHSKQQIVTSFVPSIGLVKITYSTLWMKLSDHRYRIFICQLSFCGTSILHAWLNWDLPNVAHFKALDIWFFICLGFILLPLLKCIAFNFVNSRIENQGDDVTNNGTKFVTRCSKYMDKTLRLMHPLGLSCCAVIFFSVYSADENSTQKTL